MEPTVFFNISYYDLLIGFDGTISPLIMSLGILLSGKLSFHIPTITTTLTGSEWVKNLYPNVKDCISVIERDDDNESDVIEEIVKTVISCALRLKRDHQDQNQSL